MMIELKLNYDELTEISLEDARKLLENLTKRVFLKTLVMK